MEDKKLNAEEIELLERQGLVADIRNKLGTTVNLLALMRISNDDTDEGRFAKKYLEEHMAETAADAERSIAHILGAMTYSQKLPDEGRLRILSGKDRDA